MLSIRRTSHLGLTALLTLAGCSGEPDVRGLVPPTPTATPTATVAAAAAYDVETVVNSGLSLTFNDQTGGVNDLALNPVTALPAILYYDKNAVMTAGTTLGALRYAYLDAAGAWHVEVIDANYGVGTCGAANSYCIGAPNTTNGATASILKLAFRSDGRPVAAYVFGASRNTAGGSKQIRYAERSAAGQWTISTAFSSPTAALPTNAATATTVDPMKGLQLTLDGNDRPHLFFTLYTQTIANSVHMYLFRDNGGSWSSTVVAPAVSGGTITAIGQGVQQAGAAWCQASGAPIWSTGLVEGGAGVTRPMLVACTGTNADGSCAGFSTTVLTNGCGTLESCFSATVTPTTNGGQRTDLVIDAATQRPLLGISTVSNPATTLLTAAAPLSCEQAQPLAAGAWGAPVTVATASAGANGFRLASSDASLNENLIAYSVGTTAVRINRASGPSGAWLGTGTLVEATTVGAEGIGFAFEPFAQTLHVSYAQLPAASSTSAGNDIKVAYGYLDDISDGAAATLALDFVDNLTTAFAVASTPMLSAARSPAGQLGIAYFFQDLTTSDARLYYGTRGGTSTAPVFGFTTVFGFADSSTAPQFVGAHPSLAYDVNDQPVIAFYDGRTATKDLYVARSADGGTHFSATLVDAVGDVGQYASVATFGSTIGVAYYDLTNTALKFARYEPGRGWRRFAVEGLAGLGSCGNVGVDSGKYAVLRFDSAGHPAIAYQSQTALRLAVAAETASSNAFTWRCLTLDASGTARGEGIAFQLAKGDLPRLVHFDSTVGVQRYVRCDDTLSNCMAAGPTGFFGSDVAATGSLVAGTSRPSLLVFDDGREFIGFPSASFRAFALASRTAASEPWGIEYLNAAPAGTSFPAVSGQYGVLVPNDTQGPAAIYRSYENWLRYFSRETP